MKAYSQGSQGPSISDYIQSPHNTSTKPYTDSESSLESYCPSGPGEKGPRSRVVEAILLLLYTRPMRSSEIASILGKATKLVSSYLSYWRSRGYVSFKSGYWFLTQKGEEHVKTFLASLNIPILSPHDVVQLAQKLIKEQVLETVNNWKKQEIRQEETVMQLFAVRQTGSLVGKQGTNKNEDKIIKALQCLNKIIGSKDLVEDEIKILEYMVKHYAEWGSTYLYLDQLSEELHYPVNELLLTLRKLQTKKLIYLYTDRRFGIRVGLGKSLKQLLDLCISK